MRDAVAEEVEIQTRRIVVCDNVDCRLRGANEVFDAIEDMVEDEDLDVEVDRHTCFSGCKIGPNVALLPERVWYAGVTVDDVAEIVSRHVRQGERIERLTKGVDETVKGMIMNILEDGGWGSVY